MLWHVFVGFAILGAFVSASAEEVCSDTCRECVAEAPSEIEGPLYEQCCINEDFQRECAECVAGESCEQYLVKRGRGIIGRDLDKRARGYIGREIEKRPRGFIGRDLDELPAFVQVGSKPFDKRRTWIGKRRTWIGKRRTWIGKRRTWIGKRRTWIGKRRTWIGKRRGLIGKRRGLIGR